MFPVVSRLCGALDAQFGEGYGEVSIGQTQCGFKITPFKIKHNTNMCFSNISPFHCMHLLVYGTAWLTGVSKHLTETLSRCCF